MIRVDVDQASLAEMRNALGEFGKQLPRHLATAVNRVSKSVRVDAAKRLGQVVNIGVHGTNLINTKPLKKAQTLKKTIRQKRIAKPEKASAIINLWGGFPFPIKYHQGYEYAKVKKGKRIRGGVRYKTRKGGGWITILDGFIIARFGGNVFKRPEGSKRLQRMLGLAPADYFKEASIPQAAARVAAERLPIEIRRRIRELNLARTGQIQLRASKGLGR